MQKSHLASVLGAGLILCGACFSEKPRYDVRTLGAISASPNGAGSVEIKWDSFPGATAHEILISDSLEELENESAGLTVIPVSESPTTVTGFPPDVPHFARTRAHLPNGTAWSGPIVTFATFGEDRKVPTRSSNWHQDGPSMSWMDKFGSTLVSAGDINGDGYADFLLGAPEFTSRETLVYLTGRVVLFLGGPENPSQAWQWSPSESYAESGRVLAGLGDVDSDGFDDFAVGIVALGRVHVFRGGAGGPGADPTWTIEGTLGELFGYSVTGGDFDCNGYADLAIGVPGAHGAAFETEGDAHVYFSGPAGLSTNAGWSAWPMLAETGAALGVSVLAVAGDGACHNLAIGAPGAAERRGNIHVFLGSLSGLGFSPLTLEGTLPEQELGFSLWAAGDINGAGSADFFAGSAYQVGDDMLTVVSFFQVWDTGISYPPVMFIEEGYHGNFLSMGVGVGDVDGDSLPDYVIYSPRHGPNEAFPHTINLRRGGSGTPNVGDPIWWSYSDTAYSYFDGVQITGADVNGDGLSDMIFGFPNWYDPMIASNTHKSRVEVFYGRSMPAGLAAQAVPFVSEGDRVTVSLTVTNGMHTAPTCRWSWGDAQGESVVPCDGPMSKELEHPGNYLVAFSAKEGGQATTASAAALLIVELIE